MNWTISTDFCIAGKKYNKSRPNPRLLDEYDVEPEEFFLAENLNFNQNKPQPRKEIRKSKSFFTDRSTPKKTNISTIPTMVGLSFMSLPEVLSPDPSLTFHESKLHNFYESGASLFDGLRPLPDKKGFFPYQIYNQNSPRVMIRISNIDFRDSSLEIPPQYIETFYIYMTLMRGTKIVSNVIEIEVMDNRDIWKPITFDNYDWILASNQEVSLVVQVVAAVRIASNNHPYVIKYACLGQGSMKLISLIRGKFEVLINPNVPITIQLTRKTHSYDIEESEIVVEFVGSIETCPYRNLPIDFIFPSVAGPLLDCMRKSLMETYDPFYGCFDLWNPLVIEPIFLKNLCNSTSEKVLYKLITSLKGFQITDARLRNALRKLHPATQTIPLTNPNSLHFEDTPKTASVRVSNQLLDGNIQPTEKFKPFHTDELKHKIFIQTAAFWDNL